MSGTADPVRVLLRIDIEPGHGLEFEQLWHAHAAHVRTLPDNLGQALMQDRAAPDTYVVLTDWVDEPAFRAFERSTPQQEYLNKLWPIRTGGSMTLLRSLS